MKVFGTWHTFLVEQLAEEGDVKGFLTAVVEEYQNHRNLAIIQLALKYIVEAQGGISELTKKIHIDTQILLEVLDDTQTPNIDTLRTVLSAFGCCLPSGALETVNPTIAVATDGVSVTPEVPKHNLD